MIIRNKIKNSSYDILLYYLVTYKGFDLRSYIYYYVCLDDFIDSIEKNTYFIPTDNNPTDNNPKQSLGNKSGEVYKILNKITKIYKNYKHPLSTLLNHSDLDKIKTHINSIIDYILSNNAFELLNDYDIVDVILNNLGSINNRTHIQRIF